MSKIKVEFMHDATEMLKRGIQVVIETSVDLFRKLEARGEMFAAANQKLAKMSKLNLAKTVTGAMSNTKGIMNAAIEALGPLVYPTLPVHRILQAVPVRSFDK